MRERSLPDLAALAGIAHHAVARPSSFAAMQLVYIWIVMDYYGIVVAIGMGFAMEEGTSTATFVPPSERRRGVGSLHAIRAKAAGPKTDRKMPDRKIKNRKTKDEYFMTCFRPHCSGTGLDMPWGKDLAESGQIWPDLARFGRKRGQFWPVCGRIVNDSLECQVVVFPQFSSCQQRPLDNGRLASSGRKPRRKSQNGSCGHFCVRTTLDNNYLRLCNIDPWTRENSVGCRW